MLGRTIKTSAEPLFNSGLHASVPDLTTSDKYKCRSGFPPGTTVDELWIYRRKRRPVDCNEDQIALSSGSFENIKSEYNKKYRDYFQLASSNESISFKDLSPLQALRPEDNLGLVGEHDMRPLYNEEFRSYPREKLVCAAYAGNRKLAPRCAIKFGFHDNNDNISDIENNVLVPAEAVVNRKHYTEFQSKFSAPHMIKRRSLKRQKSALKLEGEIISKTEQTEKYIDYLISQTLRPPIARKSTTLKLEGDMDTKTEFREKFVPLNLEPRPPLAKKHTNLHLEGELDILTENLEKYIAFELQQRPPLEKKHTNLHMEGDMYLEGEYATEFVPYQLERVAPRRPVHNLKIDGTFYDLDTENKSKFITHDIHPPIPFLRQSRSFVLGSDEPIRYAEYKEKYISHPRTTRSLPRRPDDYFKPQVGQFDCLSEHKREFIGKSGPRAEISKFRANIQFEGTMDLKPEYQNAYQKHRLESPRLRSKRTVSYESNLKSQGSMDTVAEYKSSFVDFPRKRPNVKRPTEQIGYFKGHALDQMSEKKAQYVKHSNTSKVQPLKRATELQLEGNFECQPEYRKAYIDYLVRERVERKPRPLDQMGFLEEPKKLNSKTDVMINNVASTSVDTSNSLPVTVVEKVIPTTKSHIPVLIPSSRSPSPSMDHPPQSPSTIKKKSSRPPKSGKPSRIPTSTDSSSSTKEPVKHLPKPKLSNRKQLSPTPTPRSSRGRSASPRNRVRDAVKPPHIDRTGSRFSSPVRVEDMAYVPSTSPIPLNVLYPREKVKKKCTDTEPKSENRAFYVIDKNFAGGLRQEVNNNDIFRGLGDLMSASKARSLYREQKWMPSWSHSSYG